jgi:hypothetical protein
MHFPPLFFDIMTHLLYHLVDELDVCGPVATKWMYFIEKYMKTWKLYMCNMARPEASMVEGYIQDECLCFITEYLQKFDIVKRRIWDADEEKGDVGEVLEGVGTKLHMSTTLHDLAHQYVLTNIAIMVFWTR